MFMKYFYAGQAEKVRHLLRLEPVAFPAKQFTYPSYHEALSRRFYLFNSVP